MCYFMRLHVTILWGCLFQFHQCDNFVGLHVTISSSCMLQSHRAAHDIFVGLHVPISLMSQFSLAACDNFVRLHVTIFDICAARRNCDASSGQFPQYDHFLFLRYTHLPKTFTRTHWNKKKSVFTADSAVKKHRFCCFCYSAQTDRLKRTCGTKFLT